jgi:hypothetical protein
MRNPFRYFDSSPEVILLTVMLYVRYPLSLRQVEDILRPARRAANVTDSLLCAVRFGSAFPPHLRSLRGYDEPKTLSGSVQQFCPTSADAVRIGDDQPGPVIAFHRALQKGKRSLAIPAFRGKDFESFAS